MAFNLLTDFVWRTEKIQYGTKEFIEAIYKKKHKQIFHAAFNMMPFAREATF